MNRQAVKALRDTRLIFATITLFVFLFVMGAVFFIQWRGPIGNLPVEYVSILPWLAAILSLGLLVLAKKKFNKTLQGTKDPLMPLIDKLGRYRMALIQYLVFCEAAAMLNIVLFIFTEKFMFLMFAAVLMGFMLAMMPSKQRVVMELELDATQSAELES